MPDGRVVASEAECGTAVDELGGPVALKLATARLRHKSEVGGLRLDLRTTDEARAAYRGLSALPVAAGGRMLVERMAPPGVELLIAARADAVVPALVVGLGGIWTEALDDVAIVPLPADAERVEEAIRSLRGAAALAGARGGGGARSARCRRARRRARFAAARVGARPAGAQSGGGAWRWLRSGRCAGPGSGIARALDRDSSSDI